MYSARTALSLHTHTHTHRNNIINTNLWL